MSAKTVAWLIFMMSIVVLSGQENQERLWEKAIFGGVNVTQNGFDNWAAGGESAFAWQLNISYKFIQNRKNTTWSNTGKMDYGATKSGTGDMRKSVDDLKLESVLTYKMGSSINPFIAITGETQFAAGYNYGVDPVSQISAFMDPGYLRESLGAGLDLQEGINTRLGLALKQTVTTDYPNPYTDDGSTAEIETFKNEMGAESVTDVSLKVSESTVFNSKLELFSAFRALDETDVAWDSSLIVKISEHINMNMNIKLLYDKDVSAKRQLKQSMAVGLNYSLF